MKDILSELVFVDDGALTALRYNNDILVNHVLVYSQFIGNDFILMQENPRPHSSRCLTKYLIAVGID